MDVDTHPNPQPNPHHRKIDLQNAQDLAYLQNNLANSAIQKLDLHFPKLSKPATHIPLGAGNAKAGKKETQQLQKDATSKDGNHEDDDEEDDPMRRRVHDLVSEFLTTTWRSAGHNISVNGIDASSINLPHTATLSSPPTNLNNVSSTDQSQDENAAPPAEVEGIDFQYSTFDAALQHKVAALYGELEALTAQVSKLRRTAPSQGAEAYQSRLEAVMREDDERFEAEMQDIDEEDVEGLDIDQVREGWNDDVREIYEIGVGELASLAGVGAASSANDGRGQLPVAPSLTETVGKAQRAQRVAMELE